MPAPSCSDLIRTSLKAHAAPAGTVMFGLDPDIQVKRFSCIGFLDPRVYSSLALGPEDDKRGGSLKLRFDDDVSLPVMFGLDPDIQVKRFSYIGFLDSRVYSSLRSGPRMTKEGAC